MRTLNFVKYIKYHFVVTNLFQIMQMRMPHWIGTKQLETGFKTFIEKF